MRLIPYFTTWMNNTATAGRFVNKILLPIWIPAMYVSAIHEVVPLTHVKVTVKKIMWCARL